MKYLKEQSINRKKIYIVENHHEVLEAWKIYSKRKPIVLSLDKHCDSHPAFLATCCKKFENDLSPIKIKECREKLRSKYQNKCDISSIYEVIDLLVHDEFHDAAICLDIIEKSIIINYQSGCGSMNENIFNIENGNLSYNQKSYSNERIIEVPLSMSQFCIGLPYCNSSYHNEDCISYNLNFAIDDKVLRPSINLINKLFNSKQWQENYILDIDLDYFQTLASINHDSVNNCHTLHKGKKSNIELNLQITTFYKLIKNSIAISIAKESDCVKSAIVNEFTDSISSEMLLEKLLTHIEIATRE